MTESGDRKPVDLEAALTELANARPSESTARIHRTALERIARGDLDAEQAAKIAREAVLGVDTENPSMTGA